MRFISLFVLFCRAKLQISGKKTKEKARFLLFLLLGDKLSHEYKFPVSRATLYNTINLFMELRLVIRHRFQGTTKYEACYDNNSHCHQMCTVCGKVTEVHSPEITQAISDLHLKRFRKDGFTLYIYGICSTCQAKITRQKKLKKTSKTDNDNESR